MSRTAIAASNLFCFLWLLEMKNLNFFLAGINGKANVTLWYFMNYVQILSLKGVILKTIFYILGFPPRYVTRIFEEEKLSINRVISVHPHFTQDSFRLHPAFMATLFRLQFQFIHISHRTHWGFITKDVIRWGEIAHSEYGV